MHVAVDPRGPKKVLFVCEENASRSQMAAAIFNRMTNPGVVRALSAGTRPAKAVHPHLKAALHEVGIELPHAVPQLVSPSRVAGSDVLITLGCGDSCPTSDLPHDEWQLPETPDSSIEQLRPVRDEIVVRVKNLVAARPWA
jgi:arsenate reductase (thioredoxin)